MLVKEKKKVLLGQGDHIPAMLSRKRKETLVVGMTNFAGRLE